MPDEPRVHAQTDVGIGDVRNDGETGRSDSELLVLGPSARASCWPSGWPGSWHR